MKVNFKSLSDDIVFKHVFSQKKYALDFVKTFFNLSDEDISDSDIIFLDPNVDVKSEFNLEKTKYLDKNLRTDLVISFKNTLINIEAYSCFNKPNIEKSKQYITRLYSTQLEQGDSYSPIKVIQINICKTCPVKDKELLNHYGILDYKTGKPNMFGNDLDIYVVCLDKMNKEEYNVGISDRLSKYFMMFINEDYEKSKKITEGDEVLMSIQDCVKRFMNDENTNRIFNHERKIRDEYLEVGREQGREQGLKAGRKNEKFNMAKKMLKRNFKTSDITDITGLSENDVLSLKKKLKLA